MGSGSEERIKTEVLKVRVAPHERDEITARAHAAGLPLSGFCRAAALGRRIAPRPPEISRGLADLGRLGGLLKLALTQVDQGRLPPAVRGEIESTLASIRALAESLRA